MAAVCRMVWAVTFLAFSDGHRAAAVATCRASRFSTASRLSLPPVRFGNSREQEEPAMITITIWHNVAHDAGGRHSAMLDGYQPGDPVVAVFTYQADPAGRTAEDIADEAYDTFNDHPRDPDGADLACAYYQRRLRSLSFPRKLTVLQQVVLPSPQCHVAQIVVEAARRADVLRASAAYKEVASMTNRISQRPVPPIDPPERFAGGEVVAAARCQAIVLNGWAARALRP
jgi:hypothetical protein